MITEKEHQLQGAKAKILAGMTDEEKQDEEDFQELLIRAERLKDSKSSPGPQRTGKVFPFPFSRTS